MAAPDITREAIRKVLLDKPGIKVGEVSKLLGIAPNTARKHIRAIRKAWGGDETGVTSVNPMAGR